MPPLALGCPTSAAHQVADGSTSADVREEYSQQQQSVNSSGLVMMTNP